MKESCTTQPRLPHFHLCEQMETDPGNRRWSNYWNEYCAAPEHNRAGRGDDSLQEVYPAALSSQNHRGPAIISRPGWTVIKQAHWQVWVGCSGGFNSHSSVVTVRQSLYKTVKEVMLSWSHYVNCGLQFDSSCLESIFVNISANWHHKNISNPKLRKTQKNVYSHAGSGVKDGEMLTECLQVQTKGL